MKKVWLSCLPLASIAFVVINFSSCAKEKSVPPNISLNTESGYLSKDTTVTNGTIFNLGIKATKTGTDGLLTSCVIKRSINGGADSIIQQMNFVYTSFSPTYSYIAGDSGNVERYTFTVGQNNGLSNSVSITLTDI